MHAAAAASLLLLATQQVNIITNGRNLLVCDQTNELARLVSANTIQWLNFFELCVKYIKNF